MRPPVTRRHSRPWLCCSSLRSPGSRRCERRNSGTEPELPAGEPCRRSGRRGFYPPRLWTIFFVPPSQVPTTLPSACASLSTIASVKFSTPFFLILSSISVFNSPHSFLCDCAHVLLTERPSTIAAMIILPIFSPLPPFPSRLR